jgi:hypothetical protein
MKTVTISGHVNVFSGLGLACIALGAALIGMAIVNQSAPTAAAGGASIAVAAAMVALFVQSRKEAVDASKFYAEAAVSGMEQALELMATAEPERTRWVAASETIRHVVDMYKCITEKEHRSFFWMRHAALRLQIGEALGYKKDEPWLYFGKTMDNDMIGLFFAASLSTPPIGENGKSIGSVTRWIPLDRITMIYDFVNATEDEPRTKMDSLHWRKHFDESEMPVLKLIYPGLHKYALMHRIYYFYNGQIHRISDKSIVGIQDRDFKDIAFPDRIEG